jgi:hypothetical protein
MSKITFRADEDLVDRVERLDASKSEVMREALRAYLDGAGGDAGATRAADGQSLASGRAPARERPLDDLLAARIDELLVERLDGLLAGRTESADAGGQDIDLTISLAGAEAGARDRRRSDAGTRVTDDASSEQPREDPPASDAARSADVGDRDCSRCGESLSDDHVYCPNCGEKATRRVFCDCGDEIRTDWAFCPGCGRRTPAADVLDNP